MMSASPTRQETLTESALNALPHPVVLLSPDGSILTANQAAEQFFQTSASILARHGLAHFIPFGSPLFSLIDAARQNQATIAEYRVDIGSPRIGEQREVDIYASPAAEPADAVALVLLPRSMTEKIDRQLTHRGAARTVSSLAAMLAHEIKNPLSGIRGAAQLLEQNAGEDDRALTRLIRDEADRIVGLVDRMEIFADDRPLDRAPINIHVVLGKVKKIAQSGFARGIRISEDYDPSLPRVLAHEDQFTQLFLNLVKNAAEAFDRDHGREIVFQTAFRPGIRLSVPGTDQRVSLPLEFVVADNGPGIPEDVRAHVFDPFVTTKANGTGLGLALAAKIVGDHGGIIEVRERNPGTAFRILMPAYVESGSPMPARRRAREASL